MKEYMDLLGMKAEDRVTGFKGVVSSVCFDLYGCVLVTLSPSIGSDGKLDDARWFDHKRLVITAKKPVMDRPNFEVMKPGAESGPEIKPAFRQMPAI